MAPIPPGKPMAVEKRRSHSTLAPLIFMWGGNSFHLLLQLAPLEFASENVMEAKIMSFHLNHLPNPLFRQAIFAAGLSLVATQGLASADAPFAGLSGYWSGGGAITLANGSSERIRCKATYAVQSGGRAMNQSLRCASDSYKLDISSNIIFQGGSVSGSWSEATRGVSGSISGRATNTEIQAHVAGGAFTASLYVHTQGNSQSVSIRPQGGTNVTSVSVTLHKG